MKLLEATTTTLLIIAIPVLAVGIWMTVLLDV
jgi:uncharacterized membrane protein